MAGSGSGGDAALYRRFVPNAAMMCEGRGRVFNMWNADVAVMFVDLSGYSAVASAMAKEGPHALFAAVNGYFDRIIRVTHAAGGDVLTFAGDAMIAIWWIEDYPKAAARQAARCALDIQAQCGTHDVRSASTGALFQLRCHIGLSFGSTTVDVLHDPTVQNMQQAFPFFGGKAFSDIKYAVETAKAGEVAITANFAAACGGIECFDAEPCPAPMHDAVPSQDADLVGSTADTATPTVVYKVSKLLAEPGVVPAAAQRLSSVGREDNSEAAFFLHPRFVELLNTAGRDSAIAELRYLAVLFIKMTADVPVATWFGQVFQALDRHNCSIIQVLEDDKGVHIVAAHNLFVADSSDVAKEAIDTCATLVELDAGVCVGAACGTVFCGVVGSHQAARWDITSMTCVRACRLMQFAESAGSACGLDDSIYRDSGDITRLAVLASGVSLKGWAAPSTAYTLSPFYDPAAGLLYSPAASPCPAVNTVAVQMAKAVVSSPAQIKGCIISGEPGSGKKTVIAAAVPGDKRATMIVHRAKTNDASMAIARSISQWFLRCDIMSVQEAATQVHNAMITGHSVRAHNACMALVASVLASGLRLVIIVDNAAALDKASAALIADTLSRGDALADSAMRQSATAFPGHPLRGASSGSPDLSRTNSFGVGDAWVYWALTHTPIFGEPDAEALRNSLRCGAVPVATLRPMRLKECEALWNASAAWKSGAGCAEALFLKSGGNPGCMLATWAHFRASVQRAMKARNEGKDVPLVGQPAAEGVMYVSEQSRMQLAETSWFDLDPGICGRLLRLYDSVTAELRIVLRVVASVAYNDEMVSVRLLHAVMKDLEHGQSWQQFSANIGFLCDLFVLRRNGVDECGFRLPAMQEAVVRLQPPDELLKSARLASKEIMARAHASPNDPMYFIAATRLARRARDSAAAEERLHAAWKLCRDSHGPDSQMPCDGDCDDEDDGPASRCRMVVLAELESAGFDRETGRPFAVKPPPATVEQLLASVGKRPMPMPVLGMKNWQPPFVLGALAGELLGIKKHVLQSYLHFARGGSVDAAPAAKLGNDAVRHALAEAVFQRTTIETLVPVCDEELAANTATPPPASVTPPGAKPLTPEASRDPALAALSGVDIRAASPRSESPSKRALDKSVSAFMAEVELLQQIIDKPLSDAASCVEAAKLLLRYANDHVPPLVKRLKRWAASLTELPPFLVNSSDGNTPWRRCVAHLMKAAPRLEPSDICTTVLDMIQLGWQPPYQSVSAANLAAVCLRDRTAKPVEAKAALLVTVLAMAVRGDFNGGADMLPPATNGDGGASEEWVTRELTPSEGRHVALCRMQVYFAWTDIRTRLFPDPKVFLERFAAQVPDAGRLLDAWKDRPAEDMAEMAQGLYDSMNESLARFIAWRSNAETRAPMEAWISSLLAPSPQDRRLAASNPLTALLPAPPIVHVIQRRILGSLCGAMSKIAEESEGRFVDCDTACAVYVQAATDQCCWVINPSKHRYVAHERRRTKQQQEPPAAEGLSEPLPPGIVRAGMPISPTPQPRPATVETLPERAPHARSRPGSRASSF